MVRTSFLAPFAVLLSQLVVGDLPVHCLRHQMTGEWEFTLTKSSNKRLTCGHKHPDSQDQQPPLTMMDTMAPDSTLHKHKFTLSQPNLVEDAHGRKGTWTMIYDEGFEVAIGDHVYFAFSKFDWEDGPNKQRTNVSHCDQTQIGWYRNKARSQWGCYHGAKAGVSDEAADDSSSSSNPSVSSIDQQQPQQQAAGKSDEDTLDKLTQALEGHTTTAATTTKALNRKQQSQQLMKLVNELQNDKEDQMESPPQNLQSDSDGNDVDEQTETTTTTTSVSLDDPLGLVSLTQTKTYQPWVPDGGKGYDTPMENSWVQKVADALNFLQLGWQATAYDMFQGKTPREINRFAGVRRHRPAKHQEHVAPKDAQGDVSFLSLASKTQRARRAAKDTIDKPFDWRKKDGHDWLTPVVTQGDCGSCYTISAVHMLTARNKIRGNKPHGNVQFSVSFPLYCAEYNQGCDGGYGFLQTKWSEDVGLIPESCAPFSTGGGACLTMKDCDLGPKRYRAANHHYVGGYYGATDAEAVRRELVSKGPVVMSFEPSEDFMYYKTGVYMSGPHKIHQEWEQVDHAVLLIGYGKEEKKDYWTMQNSWGDDWGEEGYFRMARGIDESGCESIVVAADVVEENDNFVLEDFIREITHGSD